MSAVCVFDVNETLLDLKALDPHFERFFGEASVRQEWFKQMLVLAFVGTITGAYNTFGTYGGVALDLIVRRREITLSTADRSTILGTMTHLPPHPDVKEGLDRLRNAGLRLVTLTNSTRQVAEQQITNAGLSEYFEELFSADSVKKLKPAPEPYVMVAERLGVAISDLWLIAAHDWDIAGASRAGCSTAFIARPGMMLNPLFDPPKVMGVDLQVVAESIIQQNDLL